jgi:hypothetical protein
MGAEGAYHSKTAVRPGQEVNWKRIAADARFPFAVTGRESPSLCQQWARLLCRPDFEQLRAAFLRFGPARGG